MKKWILAGLLLPWLCFAHAQAQPTLTQQLQHLYQPLDKTQLATGYLFDLVVPLCSPEQYRGLETDTNRTDLNAFGCLYGEMYGSYALPSGNQLPAPSVYLGKRKAYRNGEPIPVTLMSWRFDLIRPDAGEQNLLALQNDQVFDVPGRPESPYLQDTAYAAALLAETADTYSPAFTLPADLLFSNLGGTAPDISIDPGDGLGWRPLHAGDTVQADYTTSGPKTVLLRWQFGGFTRVAHTTLTITEAAAGQRSGMQWPQNLYSAISVTASKSHLGEAGKGTMHIFYNQSDCNSQKRLIRPLIVIEGFELPGITTSDYNRMFDLLDSKDWSNDGENLTDYLYPYEYDLVYVDFEDGSDYIQRNAYVVEEVIKKVNELKAEAGSTEQNVVIGVSMGGVAGMYALKDMNNNGPAHDCRLFITYDSPLRGANIPISTQCLIQFLSDGLGLAGGGLPVLQDIVDAIQAPTPRQLLLYHVNAVNGEDEPVNTEQTAFLAELDGLGTIGVRHVALSNGTENGTFQEFTALPGYNLFVQRGEKEDSGGQAKFDIVLNATHNNLITTVFYGFLEIDLNFPFLYKTVAERIINCYTKPIDLIPGGSSNLGLVPLNGLEVALEDYGFTLKDVGLNATHHTFIPTFSALNANDPGVYSGQQACGAADRCSATEQRSISEFSGQLEYNQGHIALDARIAGILVDELLTNTPAPFQHPFRLNPVLSTYFNVGIPIYAPIPSLDITGSSGKLSINNAGKIGYANANDPDAKLNTLVADTECDALINVEANAMLTIGADDRSRHGVLRVNTGSTVHVHPGGILRITSAQSGLIIEQGAVLVIDPGAQVILEDAESFIQVKGKIIWNGDFNYSGLGYFDFTSVYQIAFAPNLPQFRLIGQTPYNRFLRLQAPLNLPAGMDLNLQNGGVEYTAGGTIAASNGAEVNLQAMRLYGTATLAFDAQGCGKIDIQNSRFEGLEQVGNVYGGTTNNKCTITNATFSGYFFGLYMVNRQEVNLTNCTFASTGGGITLLSHNNVVTRMKSCQIDGSGSGAGVGLNGGLLFWMDGGRISNCTDGIFCSADQSGFEPANILLSNHATIENCENGVRADGNLTKGLLMATCSHFLHNKTGIRGTDLRLLLNWTQLTPSNLYARKPNRFLRASNHANADRYIDVCYRTFNPGTINAGHNLWLEDGFTGPVVVSNPLPHIRAAFSATNVDCVNGTALSVIAAPAAANQAQICLTEETPDPGPCIRCEEFTGGGGTVIDQFEAAFVLLPEDEAEEDVYTALERFSPVADLWQAALPESLSHTCQDYIRAARSLTEGLADIGPRQQAAPLAAGTRLVLRPNPAAQGTWIDLPGVPVMVRVFDAFGQLRHQAATATTAYWLPVGEWPNGAYSVQVRDSTGHVKSAVLIIQR